MTQKPGLRDRLRKTRRDHVTSLPDTTRALLFRRPPSPIVDILPDGCTVGLYASTPYEAPAAGYGRWFHENGYRLALPWFADAQSPMTFRQWVDPWVDDLLSQGPFGTGQPSSDAPELVPDVVFVPLLGFTEGGSRIGQGGGHYDRWLAANRDALAIGLAWDVQAVAALPVEDHDIPLDAVVTPTCVHGPFARDKADGAA